MKKVFITLFSLILIGFSACTIREDIHFNKDFSGHLTFKLDMEAFATFYESMEEADSTETDVAVTEESFKDVIDSMAQDGRYEEIAQLSGISNFELQTTDYAIIIDFDFADIASLNTAYQKLKTSNSEMMSEGEDMENSDLTSSYTYFSQSGKSITYSVPRDPSEEEVDAETEEYMESMDEMISMETFFTFDRTIKSTSSEAMNVEETNGGVLVKIKISEIAKAGPNPKVTIKLK